MAGIPKPAEQRQGHPRGGPLEVVVARESPVDICPNPPTGLLKSSKDRWAAFWSSPISRAVDLQSDGHRLERWIRAVDEWERVGKAFRRERIVEGSQGQPVLNPLASYMTSLEREIKQAETDLGLTPMARLRLGIAIGEARMTAQELNRRLQTGDEGDQVPPEDAALMAEWSEA